MSTKVNFAIKHRRQNAAEDAAREIYAQLSELSIPDDTFLADMTAFAAEVLKNKADLFVSINALMSKATAADVPFMKQKKLHNAALERAATYLEYVAQAIRCNV